MTSSRRAVVVAALLCMVPLASCGEARTEPEEVPAESGGPMDGLSPEEMQQRVEAMSPAQAESMGTVIDTTITVGSPVRPDSELPAPILPGAPPSAGQ